MSIKVDHRQGGYCPKCENIAARSFTAIENVTLTGFEIESATHYDIIALVYFTALDGSRRVCRLLMHKDHCGAYFMILPSHALNEAGKYLGEAVTP